ncbi:MAG: RDD family protein [Calditrichota bacterium]
MFCPKCGTQVESGVAFCQVCGTPAKNADSPASVYYPSREPTYGGFWIRVMAAVVDSVILGIASFLSSFAVGGLVQLILSLLGYEKTTVTIVSVIGGYLFGSTLGWLYFAWFESSAKQGTPGKIYFNLAVTDLAGKRITFVKATGRYFCKQISSLILGIGFIMVAFSDRKQGLHDLMAGTYVVRR